VSPLSSNMFRYNHSLWLQLVTACSGLSFTVHGSGSTVEICVENSSAIYCSGHSNSHRLTYKCACAKRCQHRYTLATKCKVKIM